MEWHLSRKLVVASGIGMLFLLFPIAGRSGQAIPPHCPSLPEQGPANTVSLYVAKTLDRSGVCVRVVNGFNVEITHPHLALTLQKWEEGHGEFSPTLQKWEERQGEFHPFGMTGGALLADLPYLPAGGTFVQRLPGLQPTPPGRYRACFQFRPAEQNKDQQVCSEEIKLP